MYETNLVMYEAELYIPAVKLVMEYEVLGSYLKDAFNSGYY